MKGRKSKEKSGYLKKNNYGKFYLGSVYVRNVFAKFSAKILNIGDIAVLINRLKNADDSNPS